MSTVTARVNGLSASASFTVGTTPPPPPPSSMIVGAAVGNVSNVGVAQNVMGSLDALRIFYSGSLPTSYSTLGVPAGKIAYVSYKTASGNTAQFVKSCPAGTRVIYHHEPENDYGADGSKFVTEFVAQYDLIKAANPKVIVSMAAMSFQYNKANPVVQQNGVTGTYLPPSSKVDEYLIDDYQNKLSSGAGGLAVKPDFQGWYSLVKGRGKPLGFAEYGRGVNPAGSTTDQWTALRPKVMAADQAWLKAHPGFNALLYWYWSGAAGEWRFKDAGSAAAFKAFRA